MSRTVFISSRDSEGYNNNTGVWEINAPDLNYMGEYEISLAHFSMTNTRYPVNTYNNTLVWNEDGGGDITLTIASNNYSGSQMATYLTTQMTATGTPFTVTYDAQSKKLSFAWTGITNVQFVQSTTTAGDILGINSWDTNLTTGWTADMTVTLQPTSRVLLVSNIAHYNYCSTRQLGVLAQIPVNVEFGGVVHYVPGFKQNMKVRGAALQRIELVLRDELGNPFPLDDNAHFDASFYIEPLETPDEALHNRIMDKPTVGGEVLGMKRGRYE